VASVDAGWPVHAVPTWIAYGRTSRNSYLCSSRALRGSIQPLLIHRIDSFSRPVSATRRVLSARRQHLSQPIIPIDDPLGRGDPGGDSLAEMYGQFGFRLLLGPGDAHGHGARISLWHRDGRPECMIDISHGGVDGGGATVYADRLPDGIDLFTRWAPAVYGHGPEPVSGP
jgi:hypothetical protein